MHVSLLALLGFALWLLVLGAAVVSWRTLEVIRGKKRANEFPSGIQHGSDPYWRLNRAQANTAENLPMVAAVILVGYVAGAADDWFGTLALVLLFARVGQSTIHVLSGSSPAVIVRATFLSIQYMAVVAMSWAILTRTGWL
jgi:uncharacterized MAPEG superfamily protein